MGHPYTFSRKFSVEVVSALRTDRHLFEEDVWSTVDKAGTRTTSPQDAAADQRRRKKRSARSATICVAVEIGMQHFPGKRRRHERYLHVCAPPQGLACVHGRTSYRDRYQVTQSSVIKRPFFSSAIQTAKISFCISTMQSLPLRGVRARKPPTSFHTLSSYRSDSRECVVGRKGIASSPSYRGTAIFHPGTLWSSLYFGVCKQYSPPRTA